VSSAHLEGKQRSMLAAPTASHLVALVQAQPHYLPPCTVQAPRETGCAVPAADRLQQLERAEQRKRAHTQRASCADDQHRVLGHRGAAHGRIARALRAGRRHQQAASPPAPERPRTRPACCTAPALSGGCAMRKQRQPPAGGNRDARTRGTLRQQQRAVRSPALPARRSRSACGCMPSMRAGRARPAPGHWPKDLQSLHSGRS